MNMDRRTLSWQIPLIAALLLSMVLACPAGAYAQQSGATTSKVVYVDDNGIWIANPDGSQAANIFSHTMNGRPAAAVLSPDGKTVAFTVVSANLLGALSLLGAKPGQINQDQVMNTMEIEIYLIDADGQHLRKLTNNHLVALPCWSPDSQHLAYYGQDNGQQRKNGNGLFVVDIDGHNNRELVPINNWAGLFIVGAGSPSWSPDGSSIAYVDNPSATTSAGVTIMVIGADGSNPHPLVTSGTLAKLTVIGVSWSPDQQRIAIVAEPKANTKAIYVANADGSNAKMIAKDGTLAGLLLMGFPDVAWSADSTELMFAGEITHTSKDPESYVYLVNADGTHLHTAFSVVDIASVSWQTFAAS